MAKDDSYSLQALLDLDGYRYFHDDGTWVKFEVKRVEPSDQIPHGIKYSLTFHDRHNNRILGFDNAHAIKPKKKKFAARRVVWDHKHKREAVERYEFQSPAQLLEDFYRAIDNLRKEQV